jgi:hypothetical protein
MELRRSCKFVLPKEMSPFFLWIGKYKGKNCFCKFCGLKNIRKELLPQILWIRTPNDKQNVMETFSDKMLGSIGKKLMSKVTHFLIFKV